MTFKQKETADLTQEQKHTRKTYTHTHHTYQDEELDGHVTESIKIKTKANERI